jgi:hypothetical protein
MTFQQAVAFLKRNPRLDIKRVRAMQVTCDCVYLWDAVETEQDAYVNLIEVAEALSQEK